jgi:hypothetical protein
MAKPQQKPQETIVGDIESFAAQEFRAERKEEFHPFEMLLDKINPRKVDSYAIQQMADDIAEVGFHILNLPIVAYPNEAFRKKLGMTDVERLVIQGHRRINGWFYIGANYAAYGFTKEQAEKMFSTIKVLCYYGLAEEQCHAFAEDEKYKINLKAYEVAHLFFNKVRAGIDKEELKLSMAKLILDSRIVPSGPSKSPAISRMENKKQRIAAWKKESANGYNYLLYAFKLGDFFVDQAINWLKFNRDGLQQPKDSPLVIDAKQKSVFEWHSKLIADKDAPLWRRVDKVVLDDKGDVKDVDGGNEYGKRIIQELINSNALGEVGGTKPGMKHDERKKFIDAADSDIVLAVANLFHTGGDADAVLKLDSKIAEQQARIKFLADNLDKMKGDKATLAKSIIEYTKDEDLTKLWLS